MYTPLCAPYQMLQLLRSRLPLPELLDRGYYSSTANLEAFLSLRKCPPSAVGPQDDTTICIQRGTAPTVVGTEADTNGACSKPHPQLLGTDLAAKEPEKLSRPATSEEGSSSPCTRGRPQSRNSPPVPRRRENPLSTPPVLTVALPLAGSLLFARIRR